MPRALPMMLPALVSLVLVHCAGTPQPEVTPQEVAQYNLRLKEADGLLPSYNYVNMKRAFDIYGELLPFPAFKQKTGERYIQTALVLALRERELGITDSNVLQQAKDLIATAPYLEGFLRYVDIVEHIPSNTKGITGGTEQSSEGMDDYFEWIKHNVEPINAHLKEKSTSSDLFAYLYISFHGSFAHRFPEIDDMKTLGNLFPVSPLIRFKLSIYPILDDRGLKGILDADPEFYEADLFLGAVEMQAGKLLSAEKRYLNVNTHIPKSTSAVISLASVCFQLEEFDRCLEFNDKALDLAPRYRDAILGRAMCLGYLGRHKDALAELQKMLDLGSYYLGESNYWIAWNLNELGRIDEAQTHVEKAKDYLIGHHEVMLLAGLVAYQQKRLEDAERDLTETLEINSYECEAAFYLGKIHADRAEWPDSGSFFERAASCNHQMEAALNAKIREIEESTMSAARKEKHIRKKKTQLLQTSRTKATAYYNAAAGFYNAKMQDKALSMAEKAAEHPVTREKARELITAIKQKSP